MTDDLRRALRAHFERDIGRPPLGARERILAGLSAAPPRPRRGHPQWAAGLGAVALAALVVAALLTVRHGIGTQPAGTSEGPAPRSAAGIAYDSRRGVLLLFGGTAGGGVALDDTWTWDGARWARQRPALSPAPLASPLLAYDQARQTTVLYAGIGPTWVWDGHAWRAGPTAPGLDSAQVAMAYDPTSRDVLLYLAAPGASGEHQTWRWDGATWAQLHPRTVPDVAGGTMAYDGHRAILAGSPFFGAQGQALTETWAWDGTDWTLLSPAVRLPAASLVATAYDPVNGRLVVVVAPGAGAVETWVWDGATWARLHPRHEPSLPYGAAFDDHLQRVVLPAQDGIWAWDGSDWALRGR